MTDKEIFGEVFMKKYYYVPEKCDYKYEAFWLTIKPFFLIKEGWIEEHDYSEDPNDDRYILDSYGTPGTRKDYCAEFENFKDRMFESLEEAKEEAKKVLSDAVRNEHFKLTQAYIKMLKELQ